MDQEELPEDSYLFCRLEDGKVLTRYDESQYWLKAPCADSYLKNYELCRADEVRKLCFRREEENHG